MNTKDLQHEIKTLLAEMRWTQVEAARTVHCEINESEDDEGEINRYVEAFKKQLNRPTTPSDHLQVIFDILCRQRDALRLRKIKPTYLPGPYLDSALRNKIRTISRSFDREMEDDPLSSD